MHLTENKILLYLENKISLEERQGIEIHLSTCKDCIYKLGTTYKLLKEVNEIPINKEIIEKADSIVKNRYGRVSFIEKTRKPSFAYGSVILVMLIIAALFFVDREESIIDQETMFRDNKTGLNERTADNQIIYPADNSVIYSETFTLRWMKAPNAVEYRINIFNNLGDKLLDLSTTDSIIVPANYIKLAAGKEYLWNLETALPDGRKIKSSVFSFRYSPQ